MACYNIIIKASAKKELSVLPRQVLSKVIQVIESLSEEPRPHGVRKLTGMQDVYRIRVSDYRIVYRIEDDALIVEVVKVAHRKEVYR